MLWNYLKDRINDNSNQILVEDDRVITFNDMILFADSYSEQLHGDCYGILCESELNASKALLSCIAAGVTSVPLSFRYGDKHCERIIETIGFSHIIMDDDEGNLIIRPTGYDSYKKPSCNPALIMCTSGTTGYPKGAMITQKNLMTNISDIELYFKIDKTDKILISRPLYHCAVLTGEFLISLVKGVQIHFYSKSFNPLILCNYITKNQITVFCGTPTLLESLCYIASHTQKALDIKSIVVSGECMTSKTAKTIRSVFKQTNIYNVYGLTEASPRVSWLPPEMFDNFPESVGYPLNSLKAKIVDENGKELNTGEIGELIISGPSIMQGYYNNSLNVIKDGWLHTGDLAYMDEDGRITIKCRKDNMIIRAGMNIYPQEIENAVKKCDKIFEALVSQVIEKERKIIKLQVVTSFENTKDIFEICKKELPPYEMPDKIEIVESLPKNGSGKMIRKIKSI